MFPDITGQEWCESHICEGSCCIRCRDDIEWSVRIRYEPRPSRAECCECYLVELCHEHIEISPLGLDRRIEFTRWDMMSYWCERVKVECMIPYLGCIVEYATFARMDDLFEGLRLVIRTCNKTIEIVDIGLMVSTWVELESLLTDMRRESIDGVCERWASEHRRMG